MQATQQNPAPAPPPVTAPGAPAAVEVEGTAQVAAPQISHAALRARRSELSNQLQSAEGRRNRLAESLRDAEGSDRLGIEQRLMTLDKRIVQIEQDIAENGKQLALAADAGRTSATTLISPRAPETISKNVAVISIFFMVFVLAPLAVGAAYLMWRRAIAPAPRAPAPESVQRLERIEQAVDTIAVEMERVSESQRFLTRILTEPSSRSAANAARESGEPLQLPAPAPDELALVQRETERESVERKRR